MSESNFNFLAIALRLPDQIKVSKPNEESENGKGATDITEMKSEKFRFVKNEARRSDTFRISWKILNHTTDNSPNEYYALRTD